MSDATGSTTPNDPSILLVDDHPAWTRALAEHLTREGYRVSVEHDCLAAVDRLRRELPDVLIADYFLLHLDGGKLCQIAKALAGKRQVRTIIMTAGSDRSVTRVRAPHADEVIAKNRIEVAVQDLKQVLARVPVGRNRGEIREVVGHERLEPRLLSSKVHALKHYLDALHECASDAVVGVDAQMRVYFVNHMTAELLGSDESALIARPVLDVLGMTPDSDLAGRLEAAITGKELRPRPLEAEIAGRWLRLTIAGLELGEDGRRALILARDMSALKAEEEARRSAQKRLLQTEKMAAIGQLISGVSHEINNPLAALIPNLGFVEEEVTTLLEHVGDSSQLHPDAAAAAADIPKLLGECKEACKRIRTIVADLRLFSHGRKNRGERVRLDELLQSALSLAGSQIRLCARIESDLQPVPEIVADAHALSQVFLNILINAVHALERGDPAKDVIRVVAAPAGEGVVVEISNTGPPVPPAIKQRIFEPFFTTKRQGHGVGLGLSIAHEAVHRHGGYIELESEPDQPVTFRIWIPFDTGLALREVEPVVEDGAQGAQILVVDDEAIVRNSFRRALESSHDVTLAGDGSEALEILERRRFDLVLCDLIMPGMSGMELYAVILRRDPSQAERFVFLTGGTSSVSARAFLERVPRPRAYKPIEVGALRRLVAECIVRPSDAQPDERASAAGHDRPRNGEVV